MTKDYAIQTLRCLYLLAEEQEAKEAILMAIKALKQQDRDRCKICEYLHNIRLFEYCCPKCGTKMVEVDNNGT